jgi:hypothetical protein
MVLCLFFEILKRWYFFFFDLVTIGDLFLLVLYHRLSQKFKLIRRERFNHLINTLTLTLTCGLKLHFNRCEYLIEM